MNITEKAPISGHTGSNRKMYIIAALIILAAGAAAAAPHFAKKTDNSGITALSAPLSDKHIKTKLDLMSGIIKSATEVSFVRVNASDITIILDENSYGEAVVTADYVSLFGDEKELVWFSENDTVAECENGVIKAHSPGTIEIYAKTDDGTESDYCSVTVIRKPTGIWLDDTSITLSGTESTKQLNARILPDDATGTITWSSADEEVAVVDGFGIVTAKGRGMTEITAVTDGGFSASCYVTVTSAAPDIGSIKISTVPIAALRPESTFKFKASVEQSSPDTSVKWTSSNENVAVIADDGTVTAKSDGITRITAESSTGKTDTYMLTVSSEEQNIYTYGNIAAAKPDENYKPNSQITQRHSNGITYGSSYGTSLALDGSRGNYGDSVNTTSGEVVYVSYSYTLDSMVSLHMGLSPKPKYNSSTASEELVRQHIDPNCFSSGAYKYQFLDLSSSNGLSADVLNNYLADKGTLAGHGDAYISAANAYGISEIYLVAHSCLETGNGTSRLASGVEYNGVTVYNMYGIGAVDGNAVQGGAKKAYEMGWTTPEKAIYGGAKWISEQYVNNSVYRQNTLYKMKWNPDNPGMHEYATSINWAVSQASTIKRFFDSFPNAKLRFEVPVYSGQQAPSSF